jgi:hypothetical protein
VVGDATRSWTAVTFTRLRAGLVTSIGRAYGCGVRSPGEGAARIARGSFLAVVVLSLGVGAHVAAGGSIQVGGPLVLLGLLIAAACVAASGSRWTLHQLLPLLAISQVGLHFFLAVACSPDHAHAGVPSISMIAGHGAATMVSAWWMASGESLLWTWFAVAVTRATRPLAVPALVVARPVHRIERRRQPESPTGCMLADSLVRRGPPAD